MRAPSCANQWAPAKVSLDSPNALIAVSNEVSTPMMAPLHLPAVDGGTTASSRVGLACYKSKIKKGVPKDNLLTCWGRGKFLRNELKWN